MNSQSSTTLAVCETYGENNIKRTKNPKGSTTIAVCETYGKNDQKKCHPTPKYIITLYFLQNIENQPSILNTKTNCINISGELLKTKNARYTGLMECPIISIFSPVCIQPFD